MRWQLLIVPCLLALAVTVPASERRDSKLPAGSLTHRSQPLMGTYVTITVAGAERAAALAAISKAFEAIRGVDARMSVHRPDSELSRLNSAAPTNFTPVSPQLYHVLSESQRISRVTDGAFDVTLRPVVDLWGFVWRREYRQPDGAEIENAMRRVGARFLELESGAVRFARPGMSIDLGGIAKGHAVDEAIEVLKGQGIRNAMVKAGGDLRVMGAPPGEEEWEVQLEDPAKGGARQVVRLQDKALSTSGDYENYFEQEGKRYSHIVDPRTGRPGTLRGACTVVAETCLESDALATALLLMGPERAQRVEAVAYQFHLIPGQETNGWRVLRNDMFSRVTR